MGGGGGVGWSGVLVVGRRWKDLMYRSVGNNLCKSQHLVKSLFSSHLPDVHRRRRI